MGSQWGAEEEAVGVSEQPGRFGGHEREPMNQHPRQQSSLGPLLNTCVHICLLTELNDFSGTWQAL